MDKILKFPRGLHIRITPESVVTDDFRKKIRETFHDYTEGTAKAYRVQDKLAFINLIRILNFSVDGKEKVTEFILQIFDEEGEVSTSDLTDRETLAHLIDDAENEALTNWHHWGNDPYLAEPACEFVAAAIEEVMKYDQ